MESSASAADGQHRVVLVIQERLLPLGIWVYQSKRTIRFYAFDQHFESVREAFVITF